MNQAKLMQKAICVPSCPKKGVKGGYRDAQASSIRICNLRGNEDLDVDSAESRTVDMVITLPRLGQQLQ